MARKSTPRTRNASGLTSGPISHSKTLDPLGRGSDTRGGGNTRGSRPSGWERWATPSRSQPGSRTRFGSINTPRI